MNTIDTEISESLIVRAATMLGCGAPEADVRAILVAETKDDGMAFLLLTAGRLLDGPVGESAVAA